MEAKSSLPPNTGYDSALLARRGERGPISLFGGEHLTVPDSESVRPVVRTLLQTRLPGGAHGAADELAGPSDHVSLEEEELPHFTPWLFADVELDADHGGMFHPLKPGRWRCAFSIISKQCGKISGNAGPFFR